MNLDQMLYLVISDRRAAPIIWEIEPARMQRDCVHREIREGQYGTVLHVLELNPQEGICREVTDDFREDIERDPDDR